MEGVFSVEYLIPNEMKRSSLADMARPAPKKPRSKPVEYLRKDVFEKRVELDEKLWKLQIHFNEITQDRLSLLEQTPRPKTDWYGNFIAVLLVIAVMINLAGIVAYFFQ